MLNWVFTHGLMLDFILESGKLSIRKLLGGFGPVKYRQGAHRRYRFEVSKIGSLNDFTAGQNCIVRMWGSQEIIPVQGIFDLGVYGTVWCGTGLYRY